MKKKRFYELLMANDVIPADERDEFIDLFLTLNMNRDEKFENILMNNSNFSSLMRYIEYGRTVINTLNK